MADEKEGTVTPEPVVAPTPTPEQPVPEPEKAPAPFTLEDVRKMIQEENATAFKGLQRVIAKKDKEIQSLKATPTNTEPNVDIATLRKVLNSVKVSGGDENSIREAEEALTQAEVKVKMASQLTYQQKVISENQTKFNDLIENAGLETDDSRLSNYEIAFEMAKQTGDFSVPERILAKTLKNITPLKVEVKDEVKPMSEEEINKRAEAKAQELFKKMQIDKGLLKTDTGAAGGASVAGKLTPEMVSKMSPDERWERRKEIAQIKI